jgi:hypothetical protein
MKFSYAGALVALTLASLLTACGGKAQYTVQGSISGLTLDGLQLSNGGETITLNRGATSFAFSKQIDYGASFDITVKASPPFMTCGVSAGSGTAGYTVAIGAAVTCSPTAYTVGGLFKGLKSTFTTTTDATTGTVTTTENVVSATLINGSATPVLVNSTGVGDGAFTVATLTNGDVYSVSILTQPKGFTCQLTNNIGVVRGENVTIMNLDCVPATTTATTSN